MRETAIEAACSHLGAAVVQSCASDDQIILDHVKAAYEILKVVRDSDRKAEAEAKYPIEAGDLSTAERILMDRGIE